MEEYFLNGVRFMSIIFLIFYFDLRMYSQFILLFVLTVVDAYFHHFYHVDFCLCFNIVFNVVSIIFSFEKIETVFCFFYSTVLLFTFTTKSNYVGILKLKKKLNNLEYSKNTEDICTICLENDTKLKILKCSHIFHNKCLLTWFKKKGKNEIFNCPLCQRNILEN